MLRAEWSRSAWWMVGPALAALCLAGQPARAGSKVSTGSGSWNSAASWVPAGVPGIEDSVTILAGHTVTATAACSAGVLVVKGRDEGAGPGGQFNNGTWPWRLYLRTAGGRTGNLVVESGSVASGSIDQSDGAWTTVEGDYTNGGTHVAGSVEFVVHGSTVNDGSISRSANATRDWLLRGGFINNGSYSAVSAREPLTVGTAEAGGAFVNSGEFNSSGRARHFFHGDFINNRPDADFGSEYVFFLGNTDSRIGGSGGARFWKAIIEKDDPARTVMLDTTLIITEPSWGALVIERGTLVTNGESLSVYTDYLGDAMTLGGGPGGRLLVNNGPGGRQSRVFVITLDQWDAPLGNVVVEDGLLHIREQHNLLASVARFELRGGTVAYNRVGDGANFSALSFRPYAGSSEHGWYATGGTALFRNAGIYAAADGRFVAGGSAVVRFEGNRNAFVSMAAVAEGAYSRWDFNEMEIAKTGGSSVSFNSTRTTACDVTVARPFALASGQMLTLNGSFAAGHGYRFGDVTTAAGATLAQGAAELFVEGDWTGEGAFSHGGGRVSFIGAGVTGGLAPGGYPFYRLAVRRPGGGVTLEGGMTVIDTLAVGAGWLAFGPNTLVLGSAQAAGRLVVENGGTLAAVGTSPEQRSRLTAVAAEHGYGFEVGPGGTITARHASFERMDASGVVVAAGATIDPEDNFSYCRFDRGAIAGPALKVENEQVLILQEVFFHGSAGHNVEKLADAGEITLAGGGGERWGEDYEQDPHGRIHWGEVAVEEGAVPPEAFELLPIAPSPLAGAGTARLSLPTPGRVRVRVYDAGGREVARLADWTLPAGYHLLRLDLGTLAGGAYLLRVDAGGETATRKLVLQR